MDRLAKFCEHCGRTGIEPGVTDADCRSCGGTGYEFTEAGNELRKFVVALLGDYEFRKEALNLFRAVGQALQESAVQSEPEG
jgi:hypothetical protein